MKTPTKDRVIVYIYIAGAILAVFFIYRVMGKLGLVNTAADRKKQEAANTLRSLGYFDPMILEDRPGGYVALGESKASMYAEQLRNAMSGFGTDEETVYSVFGRLGSKYNIAEVAAYYILNYDRDLLSDILNEFTDNEKAHLMGIIDELPTV